MGGVFFGEHKQSASQQAARGRYGPFAEVLPGFIQESASGITPYSIAVLAWGEEGIANANLRMRNLGSTVPMRLTLKICTGEINSCLPREALG